MSRITPHHVRRSITRCVAAIASLSWLLLMPIDAEAQARRLNNLVTELLALDAATVSNQKELTFHNPRDGWVYFRCAAQGKDAGLVELILKISERGEVLIRHDSLTQDPKEAMRFLVRGDHTLFVRAPSGPCVVSLRVRTMPETHFVRYPQAPKFPELGEFSWDWLNEHVLSSVNTLVGVPGEQLDEVVEEWTGQGRKLIAYGHLPHEEGLTGRGAFDYWDANPGFQDPRLTGLIADEFQGRQHALYPAWQEGMRLLGDKYKGTGKAFYAYCGGPGMYTRPETRALVRTVFDAGFHMAWERYHHEMPTLPEARELMEDLLGKEMTRWRAVFPECQRQMVLVLGVFATGPDLDVQPRVNYKVWMDMQMQYLATHPAYEGLFGVHWWYSGAASEELLRWERALYCHYCIEGETRLLSERFGWTYELDHLQNPDFYDGFEGWTVQPAGEDSMRTGYLERYARTQNRYWHRGGYPDDPAGNTYLWMKRHTARPNTISQEIRNLIPGAVYTVQLISADNQDIVNGRSRKEEHAVSLRLDGGDVIPGGSFRSIPVSSPWSHAQLPFENGPAWFNHHRVMFRATQPFARLTISDWESDSDPGGPIGQELMFNYVQVQPYFEEERQ